MTNEMNYDDFGRLKGTKEHYEVRTRDEAFELAEKMPLDGAFPSIQKVTFGNGGQAVEVVRYGLTKREYFAGLAMQGLISTQDTEEPVPVRVIAQIAVMQADALIAELSKQEE